MEALIIIVITTLSIIYLYKKIFKSGSDKCSKCSLSSSCQSSGKNFKNFDC